MRLRKTVEQAGLLSETEMDAHSIRAFRDQASSEGYGPKHLIYAKPNDHLGKVVAILAANKCSMVPILSCDPSGPEVGIDLLVKQAVKNTSPCACALHHLWHDHYT